MTKLLFLLFCGVFLCCGGPNKKGDINTNSVQSDLNNSTLLDLTDYANYTDFLVEVDSIVCHQKNIILTQGESASTAIRCINRCYSDTFISYGSNLLNIYDQEFDSIQININGEDQIIATMIKDYIVNPLKRIDKAETEEKVGLHLRLDKATSLENVFLYLNKLNRCYQIARKDTRAPEVMHLYFANFWLHPPPPPPPKLN